MAGDDTKVANPVVGQQLFAKQTRRILDKDRVGGVQFGKGLFVFAFDHHLGFRRHRTAAGVDQILEPQRACVTVQNHRNPRDRTLRMRRRQLASGGTGMLAQLQRTGACGRIDVIQMHDLLAHAVLFDQLQRDVIILIARQPRAQAFHPHRKGKPHLNACVKAFQIGFVIVQRRLDDLEAEGFVGMGIKGPHDAAHVDALFVRLKADGAGHGCFQQQRRFRIAAAIADRQAKVRNAHVLNLLVRTLDQAGWPVLQVGQRVFVAFVHSEPFGIAAGKGGIIGTGIPRQQARDRGVQFQNFGGCRGFCPAAQHVKCCLGVIAFGYLLDIGRMNVHAVAPLCISIHTLHRCATDVCQCIAKDTCGCAHRFKVSQHILRGRNILWDKGDRKAPETAASGVKFMAQA